MESQDFSLKALLEAHDEHRHQTPMDQVLGDGFLYSRNPVVRHLRDAFVQAGGEITYDDFCHYTAFQLSALDTIMDRKRIPCVPNVAVLRELEAKVPGKLRISDIRPGARNGIRINYLTHEASHCLGDILIPRSRDLSTLARRRRNCAGRTIGEACANVAEAFALLSAKSELERAFLRFNTYPMGAHLPGNRFCELLAAVLGLFGEEAGLRFVFLVYIFRNFPRSSAEPELARRVAEAAAPGRSLSADELELLHRFFNATFQTPQFVYATNSTYYKIAGFEDDLQTLFDFDVLELLARDAELSAAIDVLCQVIRLGRFEPRRASSRLGEDFHPADQQRPGP